MSKREVMETQEKGKEAIALQEFGETRLF